jgi:hypothetical protein
MSVFPKKNIIISSHNMFARVGFLCVSQLCLYVPGKEIKIEFTKYIGYTIMLLYFNQAFLGLFDFNN